MCLPEESLNRVSYDRRLLFASYHGYVDPSSGAAIATRDLLELLVARAWDARVLCGPALDFERGASLRQLLSDQQIAYRERRSPTGPVPFSVLHYRQNGVAAAVFVPRDHAGGVPSQPVGAAYIELLERVLAEFRPHVLLTYGGDWLAGEIIHRARRQAVKVVFALHNFAYHQSRLFDAADAVLVPSRFCADWYRQQLALRSTVIPSPLDATDADGVIATPKGQNELDLMKLVVHKPVPDLGGTLTLSVGDVSKVRLWEESTKVNEIWMDTHGDVVFATSQLPLNLWVEITSPSYALRDVQISTNYQGYGDTVKATGIWSELTAVEHDTRSAAELFGPGTPWEDMPTPPRDMVEDFGGTGLRPINASSGVANCIAIRFSVLPSGIEAEEDVYFDVTRRREYAGWFYSSAGLLSSESDSFPDLNEAANDDSVVSDESDEPDASGHIFTFDNPGLPSHEPDRYEQRCVFRANLEDFVRVNFGPDEGSDPAGNGWSGSRASPKYLWHCRHHLENQGGVWARTTGDAVETDENDIAPGHIEIGTPP